MDVRTILIAAILGFAAAGLANSLWFGLELKRYVQRNPQLRIDLDLFRFKKMVANQMYAALAQIFLLVIPPIIFVAGIMFDQFYGSDILYVIAPSVVILVVGGYFRGWEVHARNIPTATPELEDQRDAVVRTWLRKPWPDW